MDLKVLNILFNYKGTLSAREFRVGLVVLFMTLGVYFSIFLRTPIASAIFGNVLSGEYSSYYILRNILINFVPSLIPLQLILSYCTFILCVKRMRFFSSNSIITIFSGLFNYLFFSLFVSIYYLMDDSTRFSSELPLKIIAIIFGILFIIGLINLLFLTRKTEDENYDDEDEEGKLNIENYALKIGKLMLYFAIIMLIFAVLSALISETSNNSRQALLIIRNIFANIILLILYIRYVIRRVKDAGISQVWVVAIFGTYLFSLVINLIIDFHFHKYHIYSNLIFTSISNLFLASQFLLFLLPSKKETTTQDTIE